MTIIFRNVHNNKDVEIEDVELFETDNECLGRTGYKVHYNDGTFNLFPYSSWDLLAVRK